MAATFDTKSRTHYLRGCVKAEPLSFYTIKKSILFVFYKILSILIGLFKSRRPENPAWMALRGVCIGVIVLNK